MLRHRLTFWLDRAGVVDALRERRRDRDALSVLTFHRVCALPDGYPLDRGVFDTNPERFEELCAWLAEHCHVIGLDRLREAVLEGAPLPPRAVMLTFDDGYADNHAVALPLLTKYGLVATFFIATQFIEQRRLFWWDRVSYALRATRADELVLDYPAPLRFRLPQEVPQAMFTLSVLIKELHGLDLERLLDAIDEGVGLGCDPARERTLADEVLMTWEQIRELSRAGMSVQSHTRWHRTIHTLETPALAAELEGSRRDLERELEGEAVYALAYPVGKDVSVLESVTRAVADAGYQLAFTNNTGVASLVRHAPLFLPRLAVEPDDPSWHVRALLSMPGLVDGLR